VEAKKFGELEVLQKDLFGYDKRTEADLQAIQYADEYNRKRGEKIGWAILTNFELFRLWDTRRGVLVESTEWFNEFKRERTIQVLYLLSRDQVANDPSLSSLSSFRTLPEIDEKFLSKLNEWRESLASAIWKHVPNRSRLGADHSLQRANLRDVVQRTLDRLIVIRTAEGRGLLPRPYRLEEMVKNYGGDDAVQLMLLRNIQNNTFKYFDERYNSKLFGPHLADEMEVHNSPLRVIVEEMRKADFASMNADILGTTYEQYLGQTIEINTQLDRPELVPNLETRAAQGVYYTPRNIVKHIVDETLGKYLYGTETGEPNGKILPDERRKSIVEIQGLTILDPACGSGSFLIYAFDVLKEFYVTERMRVQCEIDELLTPIVQAGVPRLAAEASHDPGVMKLRSELELTLFANARIIERHLYGVDLDPQAAEVASMNLLLKALTRDERLPRILGDNIKNGNSLISGVPLDGDVSAYSEELASLLVLRKAIHEATIRASGNGTDRASEEIKIDGLEKDFRATADKLNLRLNESLRKHASGGWFDVPEFKRPFNWQIEFPELFFPESENKGFTLVIGNPPYVGFHGFAADKDFLRETYFTASGKFDIYTPFIERGLRLTAAGGDLSFICPSTFMKRGFGRKLRHYLLAHASIKSIHDFLHTKVFRDALNYTCIYVFKHRPPSEGIEINYSEGTLGEPSRPYLQAKLGDSPWVFRFGKEEQIVERIKSAPFLRELGSPTLTHGISEGIVTGKNSVLLIHESDIEKFQLESRFLRKALRGEDVKRYCSEWSGFYLIYPYVANGEKTAVVSEELLKQSCPKLYAYLHARKEILEGRTYLKDGNKDWYEIWCQRDIRQHECPKIVVPELADRSQFAFVGRDFFYVDTTFGITLSAECPFDLWYLLAVLNSRPAEYLYRKTTVPKANGFLIYKTMFLNTLRIPIPESPRDKVTASKLADLARRIQECSSEIANLERTFDDRLQASLPLLDESHQSLESDYYDVPQFWKRRHLIPAGALTLTEPVVGIRLENEVSFTGGVFTGTSLLTISYQSERGGKWKRLIELETIDDDVCSFILMSTRRYLRENSRRRAWKLPGSKASQRTVDVVLGAISLPTWGLLDGNTGHFETSLRKISELMRAFRTTIKGGTNPCVLEAERKSLDEEVDELTFGLYRMEAGEKKLVLNS
jgi:type I restriction-modification system DNA methylase subunit